MLHHTHDITFRVTDISPSILLTDRLANNYPNVCDAIFSLLFRALVSPNLLTPCTTKIQIPLAPLRY